MVGLSNHERPRPKPSGDHCLHSTPLLDRDPHRAVAQRPLSLVATHDCLLHPLPEAVHRLEPGFSEPVEVPL